MKKLGHVKEKKLVGWDLQKPRDNRMYYIGEGGANLRKMDKHIKRKQGNILNLFSANVINDTELKRMKAKKVKVLSHSVSMAASQASHSTAESVNMAGKTHMASSDMVGAGTTGPFSHAKPTSQLSGPLPAPARLRSAVPSGGGRGSINPRPLIKLNM